MPTSSRQVLYRDPATGVTKVVEFDANIFGTGTLAARPGSGSGIGDMYVVNDAGKLRLDFWDGSAWEPVTVQPPTAGSVDNRLARFDGTTGDLLQNSGITLDDNDNLTGVASMRLEEQVGDPANVANTGFLYAKDVAAVTELFYEDSAGNVRQLTPPGAPGAHASTHIRGGGDEIDADVLAITFVPTNYTRDVTPAEVTDVTELTAHLAGIENTLVLTSPAGIGFYPESDFAAAVDPTVNEDSGDGFAVGSVWVNTTSDEAFMLVDATVAAAIWVGIGTNATGTQFFDAYNTGGTSLGAGAFPTATAIPLNTERIKDGIYTHTAASASVTVTEAGTYLVEYDFGTALTGAGSTDVEARLMLDTGGGFAVVPGTETYNHNSSSTADGVNTSTGRATLSLANGDILQIQGRLQDGAGPVTTFTSSTGLRITKLGQGRQTSNTDPNAIHDNIAGEIAGLTLVTVLGGDHILIEDASDSNNKKRILASDLLGGTPGGATTEIQFNEAGAFGGDPGFTWNTGTQLFTVNGMTVDSGGNATVIGDAASTAFAFTVQNTTASGEIIALQNDLGQNLFELRQGAGPGGEPFWFMLNAAGTNVMTFTPTAVVDSFINLGQPLGIGTVTPGAGLVLDVVGDVDFTGNVEVDGVLTVLDNYIELDDIAAPGAGGVATGRLYKLTADDGLWWHPNGGVAVDLTAAGSGTPGGATTEVQFNEAGAFGGDPAFAWNTGTQLLTVNGVTINSDGDIADAETMTFDVEHSNGSQAGAWTLDWNNGQKQSVTLAGNGVVTITAPLGPGTFTIRLIQDGTGTRVPTWPGTVNWRPGSGTPALSTTPGAIDVAVMYYDGTNYWATLAVEDEDVLVIGPGSSTDNAIARWDGATGEVLQNSSVLIDDSGNLQVIDAYVELDEIAAPGAPGAGIGRLYKLTADDGLWWHPNGGAAVDLTATGAGGYATIQNEGSGLTQRDTLNFVGPGITAADDTTRTTLTLTTAAAIELTDATNAEGTADSLARSDHTHAHGNRGGGTLHALTSTSGPGFYPEAEFAGTVNPTVNEDSGDGFAVGSIWVNTTADTAFVLVDATVAAAVWVEITAGAGGGETNLGANVGTGADVFRDKTGVTLNFRGINGISDISAVVNADNIDVSGALLLPLDGTRTMTGDLNMGDQDVVAAKTITFGDPDVQTTAGATLTIDFSSHQKHRITLASNITTVNVTDPPGSGNFMVEFIQNGTGSFTVTGWPANVFWRGGTDPVFGDAANTRRLVSFYYNGTTEDDYYGEFATDTYS